MSTLLVSHYHPWVFFVCEKSTTVVEKKEAKIKKSEEQLVLHQDIFKRLKC